MELHVRRVYDDPNPGEGHRVLVDRLWPRGKSKADLEGVPWVKSVAPSDELRHWFDHQAAKWPEFKRRYFAELDANPGLVKTMSVSPPRGTGRIRLVRIGSGAEQIDLQPCGGTHVKSTAEIGPIRVAKIENKGKINRRIRLAFA
jgi:uncharacterized protein YeaO (DUF488 family)